MLNIEKITISELTDSHYVIPFRLNYVQDGKPKIWDLVQTHHSVAIIIYNTDKNALICVKQFRPGVFINSVPIDEREGEIDTDKYPSELGVTLEFCSGIVDKNKTLAEIAAEEVLEECGYTVNPDGLQKIKNYRSSVGIAGEVTTLFFTEVTNSEKTSQGGGVDDEQIEIVELRLKEIEKILNEFNTTPNTSGEFLYGLSWFYHTWYKRNIQTCLNPGIE